MRGSKFSVSFWQQDGEGTIISTSNYHFLLRDLGEFQDERLFLTFWQLGDAQCEKGINKHNVAVIIVLGWSTKQ